MRTIADALALATIAHLGQSYGSRPYIEHPTAVARLVLLLGEPSEVVQAALLHDVVEDTPITLDDLRRLGYDKRVVRAVDGVTRRYGESYHDLIARAAGHRDSRLVKLADNTHNRSTLPREDSRWLRYERARVALLAANDGVDPFAPEWSSTGAGGR